MFQKISFIGNLGQDPQMRYLPDGTAVTNFSVASNRRWKDAASGEDKSETTWFRVSVWGRRAEVCNEFLERGRKVFIEGRLRPDPHTGGPRLAGGAAAHWSHRQGRLDKGGRHPLLSATAPKFAMVVILIHSLSPPTHLSPHPAAAPGHWR
jgi:hypothetical protein